MRVEESLLVRASRERVWHVVCDPSRYDDWLPGSDVQWHPLTDQTTGVGARYRLTMQVGSAVLGWTVEIVEFDPPFQVAWTSVRGVDMRGRWRLRERGEMTDVLLRLSYAVPGGVLGLVPAVVAAPMVKANLRRSVRAVRDGLQLATS